MIRFILLICLCLPRLFATALPLANPSFESPSVTQTSSTIEGWTSTGTDVQVIREAFVASVNSTNAGLQFVRFATQSDADALSQTLANHTISKGLYTLNFLVSDVFNDSNSPRALTVKFLRADTSEVLASLTIPANQIPNANPLGDPLTQKSLTCYIPDNHPAIGHPLTIRFEAGVQSAFGQVAIDDLSLDWNADATPPTPEPLYTLNTSTLENRTDEAIQMSGTAADGTVYSVTRNAWLRNGQPWFPISGEFHYPRYPANDWDRELAKMKAAGIDVVATYVFWNHHESPQGTWSWSDRLNLRRFIQACQKNQLLVWLRIGPYVNAEALNGGIPAFANTGKRTNHPTYLSLVDLYFQQLSSQVSDLFVNHGGPIVGIQLENEFASGDPAHITTLKQLATDRGLIAPYYSVTANSRFDPGIALPLQGSYTYRGWESAGGTSPTSGFIFGTDEWTANTDLGGTFYNSLDYPRGYCELGTGSPMRGNDRFTVDPKFVVAQAYDCVGRGSNFLGYYMFHGGTQLSPWANPSWGTSYDFQAPFGEFGQSRESAQHYRRLHSFLRDFTAELVPTRVCRDPAQIYDPSQTQRLRYIGRFHQHRGFVFLNNTQRNLTLPTRTDVQLTLTSPTGSFTFPSSPVSMPDGTYAIFPVQLNLSGINLLWATCQPLAQFQNPHDLPTFIFWMPSWSNRELAFPSDTQVEVISGSATTTLTNPHLLVHSSPNRTVLHLSKTGASSPSARVILLTEADSLDASITTVENLKRLLIVKNAEVSSTAPSLRFQGLAGNVVNVEFFPSSGLLPASSWTQTSSANDWASYSFSLPPAPAAPVCTPNGSGSWTLSGSPSQWQDLAHAFVVLQYAGSSAQLSTGGTEITRDLYHAQPWVIDLKRFPTELAAGLSLTITPWESTIVGVPQPTSPTPTLTASSWQPHRDTAWNDANNNSLRDDWELLHFGNLNQAPLDDFDSDGLDNLTEQSLGTNPTQADSDADGTPDHAEVRLGLNPTNPASKFAATLTPLPNGSIALRWPSTTTTTFLIEASLDLSNWTPLAPPSPGSPGSSEFIDTPPANASKRFYRISLLAP